MDGQRFDALTRHLGEGATRRRALGLAAGGALAALAGLGGHDADAKRKKRCRKRGDNCESKKQCCSGGNGVACRVGRESGGSETVCCGVRETACRVDETDSCCAPLSCVSFQPGGNEGRCLR